LKIHNKQKEYELELDASGADVTVLEPMVVRPRSWAQVAKEALDEPLGCVRLENMELRGRKVCIITDDWGRPTPASEFLPQIIDRLKRAGVEDRDLCLVAASGMHDPMSERDLRRKMGDEVASRFRCYVHDGGDRSNLEFVGITDSGTPVWVNAHVAGADFVIVAGRVYPHETYGYEGGYKMICPGVSSFETILRDHGLNFAPTSTYGNLRNNCSRVEADMIGKLVGVDFAVNFVVTARGEPVKAFAGECDAVFAASVRYGERNVWYRKVEARADITIMSCGKIVDAGLENNPVYYSVIAANVTRDDGTIILLLDERVSERKNLIEGVDIDELSLGDLLMMHEKRNWGCDPRQVQNIIKRIRGSFYLRRAMVDHKPALALVCDSFSVVQLERYRAEHFTDLGAAYRKASARYQKPRVLVVPDAVGTLPLLRYSFE